MKNKKYFVEFGIDSLESKTSPSLANLAKAPKIQRAGFTMIEIVFVIVITGLVAVAGGNAIVQILQNYTLQKMYAKTEMDSASAIRQISNYLQNSVWDSIAFGGTIPISEVSTANDGKLNVSNKQKLSFIEKDLESQNGASDNSGNMIPYFAGFIDLNKSNAKVIASQTNSDDLEKAFNNRAGIALYFPFINVGTSTSVQEKYHQSNIQNNKALFQVNSASNNHPVGKKAFTLNNEPQQIGDIAMLVNACPSHIRLIDKPGISIDGKTYEKGDLVIARREPSDNTITYTTIAKKISNIHFWTESSSSLIRIRVCYEAGVAKSIMDEFCKEGIIMQ